MFWKLCWSVTSCSRKQLLNMWGHKNPTSNQSVCYKKNNELCVAFSSAWNKYIPALSLCGTFFWLQNVLTKACYLKSDSRIISPITPYWWCIHRGKLKTQKILEVLFSKSTFYLLTMWMNRDTFCICHARCLPQIRVPVSPAQRDSRDSSPSNYFTHNVSTLSICLCVFVCVYML